MVDAIEVGVLLLAVVGLIFARQILSSIKMLAMNAVTGILTLMIASWFGFGITVTPLTLAITALAGIPGAILVLLLSFGGVAFAPPGTGEAGQILADQASQNLDQLIQQLGEFTEFVESSSGGNGTENS